MTQYLCSLPNVKDAGPQYELYSDDPGELDAFIRRHDVPGRAVYACVNPLKPGAARRCIENIARIERLHFDVDHKDFAEGPDEIDAKLKELPLTPTVVRDSGGGRHVTWELKEAIEAGDPLFDRARDLLKRLGAGLSADPAPAHPAALLRVAGTHNSKRGEGVLVRPLWGSGLPVDITELEALVDLLPAEGLFTRKARTNGAGHNTYSTSSPMPVDIGGRLETMQFGGAGEAGVHQTQLQTSAAMLRQGVAVDFVVKDILDNTYAAMAGTAAARKWNWDKERLSLERMCMSLIGKDPSLSHCLPDGLRETFERKLREGQEPYLVYRHDRGWHVMSKRGEGDRRRAQQARAPQESQQEKPVQLELPLEGGEPRRRFKLIAVKDLAPGPEPLYLVDELIPMAGIAIVWGKAKSFKSFWTFDLAHHVAMGWEYRDRYVQQGAVVYCAFEGAHGYKKRAPAWRKHHGVAEGTDIPLYVVPGQANLIAEHRLLISDIAEQLNGDALRLVVLDTLNKSLVGSENKDVDMAAYIRAAEAVRDHFACVVIIVHHCGYDDTRPRGHSSLPGAVDAQIAITRQEDVFTATVDFMRDGPEDTQVVCGVKLIEVGEDQNGKVLTSLVVVPSDAAAVSGYAGLPKGLRVFCTALKAAIASDGVDFQPEAGTFPVKAVDQAAVRARFCATYADDEVDPVKRKARLQKAFVRALGEAQARGLMATRRQPNGQTMLWVPAKGEN